MSEKFDYNSMSVTTVAGMNEVQSSVTRTEMNKIETVTLSVLLPAESSQTLREVQKAAIHRAIEILQRALLH